MGSSLSERVSLFLSKADRKLRVAGKLYDDGEYEDAISRAYYAMYHAGRALLITRHIEPRSHEGLLSLLGQFFVKSGSLERAYGKMISYAKELRENGDYSEYYVAVEEDARIVIEDAKAFVDEIKKILSNQAVP